jgi:hypothetical protein
MCFFFFFLDEKLKCNFILMIFWVDNDNVMFIVIRPDSGVDSVKESVLGLHGLTLEVLIFHMKKLINNPCEYRLYIL